MGLKEKLAPYVNKFCSLTFTDKISKNLVGQEWRLYFFDWKKLDEDTRAEIQEIVDEDDYRICGLVNPPEETGSVSEMIQDGVDGYLLWSEDTGTMFMKKVDEGELDVVTTHLDPFLAGLEVLEEGEEVE